MRFKKKRFLKSSGILLIEYAKRGQFKKIMDLLQSGVINVNTVDPKYHSSALFWAAYHGHNKIVIELLKKGADPNLWVVTVLIVFKTGIFKLQSDSVYADSCARSLYERERDQFMLPVGIWRGFASADVKL